jgi:hypothetical protein
MEHELVWQEVIDHPEYEIATTYPHQLRKRETGMILAEYLDAGYVRCHFNGKGYRKHRIIAIQFIPNPDNLPQVDHINHIKSDNRIENLRWISGSDNTKNKSGNMGVEYTFVDNISPDSIVVDHYNDHEFENLYFHDDIFYYFNGVQYRVLHINEYRNGALAVRAQDTNNQSICIYYSRFKRQYDLI